MKKLVSIIALGLVLVTLSVSQTGCTTSQATIVYKSLGSIGAAENAAMKAAAIAKVNGKLSEDQSSQVQQAHAKFLLSYTIAVDAAAVTMDKASVPTDVYQLEQDVINLIVSFGIKL